MPGHPFLPSAFLPEEISAPRRAEKPSVRRSDSARETPHSRSGTRHPQRTCPPSPPRHGTTLPCPAPAQTHRRPTRRLRPSEPEEKSSRRTCGIRSILSSAPYRRPTATDQAASVLRFGTPGLRPRATGESFAPPARRRPVPPRKAIADSASSPPVGRSPAILCGPADGIRRFSLILAPKNTLVHELRIFENRRRHPGSAAADHNNLISLLCHFSFLIFHPYRPDFYIKFK